MSDVWYRKVGNLQEYAISTRIRLARNLSHMPFPAQLSLADKKSVVDKIKQSLAQIGGLSFTCLRMGQLSARELRALVERHLISVDFASKEGGALFLSDDERVSIMVNEEDHLRIQVMAPGEALKDTLDFAKKIDKVLDETLSFAYSEKLGCLTQCPTNLGTGMRASLMLHLPGLQECGVTGKLSATVSKLGLTVRGTYGEGSDAFGALYQISNQITLGISEEEAITNLKGIAMQIIEKEKAARTQWINKETHEDLVWRALGILKTARMISYDEALRLLSLVRVGITQGVLNGPTVESVTALMTEIQPGCLMADAGEDMDALTRDRRRAALIRVGMGES